VGQDFGPRPARQTRAGRGLLVGQVADSEEDAAGPLADRFDVGNGRAHGAQCITIGPRAARLMVVTR